MTIIMFLYFTLSFIVIQFSIIEFIEMKKMSDLNISGHDVMGNLYSEPHALYYKIKDANISQTTPIYPNTTLPITKFNDVYSSPTTFYDVLFEENVTTTASDGAESSELYTSTEYSNITEFEIFHKTSTTTPKPKTVPKKKDLKNDCFCNLNYNTCDFNCCCDDDCDTEEQQMFKACLNNTFQKTNNNCQSNRNIFSIDNLICNAKTNIPLKKNTVTYKINEGNAVDNIKKRSFIWSDRIHDEKKALSFKQYEQNDPIWLLYNGVASVIDIPVPQFNNYCSGRRNLKFFNNEYYTCLVKLQALESLNIHKHVETSQVLSVPKNLDTTDLNCTNLLCSKWKIMICNEDTCGSYNKSLHEPECTENTCRVALKVEYVFDCNVSNITNATIYLHMTNITLNNVFFEQEIKVTFHLKHSNTTAEVVHLSGNPGYLESLSIIASFHENNHTMNFLNGSKPYSLRYPDNINGYCHLSNNTYKVINFKNNVRSKCNLLHNNINNNASENCKHIQNRILNMLGGQTKKFISPLGNPFKLDDKDWIELKFDLPNEDIVHGEYNNDKSRLTCINLATKISYIFTYADVGDDEKVIFKILDCKAHMVTEKVVFTNDEVVNVITVDINFLDVTKPPVYEYAEGLNLNLYLPEDFFYPFTYNKGYKIVTETICLTISLLILACVK